MFRLFWAFLLLGIPVLLIPAPVNAEVGQGQISCIAGREANKPFKKKLWDGYEVSLGPARNSMGGGDECTAALYNAATRVVFRTTGFSVIFDEDLTGEDFDGDGKGEIVFQTDSGGGMHCCWTYNVVSLYPKPHRLFDIGAAGAVRFEKDKQGRMVIWQRTPGPYGYTSMAQQPFAEKVFRVDEGKLADSTPEFCPQILAAGNEDHDAEQSALTPEKLKLLSAGSAPDEETKSALLSLALQQTFCRQFDDAFRTLSLWPKASRDSVKSAFATSIEKDYAEFAARLRQSADKQ